ncbi:MAG: TIGR03986 family CRISPR-associated RAMP protein, partial [Muribaculaceae bacterium]|nr:TIGR03986 family CRISPR-associated RAMP protein [Muribaculaceae bacterium]
MNENRNKNKTYNNYNSFSSYSEDIEISAPYNFVPVGESVYHPYHDDKTDKSYQISHDVPFKDGISGKITFSFTAETPIFTKDADKENISSFNSIIDSEGKRHYFIPASSIKGCIRNVLEIMSYGKMTKVDNKSFGLRDLNNRVYRDKIKDVHCGWMEIHDDAQAYIEDWATPGRISIDAIASELNVPKLSELIDNNNFKAITRGKDNRDKVTSPLYKYNLLKGKNLTGRFSKKKVDKGREIYQFDKNGKEGIIVLTGQSSGREEKRQKDGKYKWVGKIFEFIFFKPKVASKPIKVREDVLKAFHTIHENSPAYVSLWSEKLKRGEKVPVFFMLDKEGKISSIGLSFMYKYPYDKDTYSLIPAEMFGKDLDLAESLFGYTDKKSAMRGRVQFSHAMATSDNIVPLKSRDFPAYSPHSSYYPIYVKGGNDWNHAHRIAGWKRYLIQAQPVYKAVAYKHLRANETSQDVVCR